VTSTRVFKIESAAAEALEQRLRRELSEAAEWRRVEYARFAVKSPGASVVCYSSGKLVLQGRQIDGFAARFLGELQAEELAGTTADPGISFDVTTIGSDEAGKGDYFGPLVVAAVHAAPSSRDELMALGVTDSKKLSDRRMYPVAERIERMLSCEVRVLMPTDYNDRWNAERNVNHLLADLHVDAIAALLEKHETGAVVVDKFADERLVATRLQRRVKNMPGRLVQVPRAEAHLVVAAASIVARVRFLEGLQECQADSGTDLHKGAGSPVDVAGRRVFSIGGTDLLRRVAKLHFKNSDRIPGLLR